MNTNTLNAGANNMRVLIASMVEKAKSGHPGGAIGGADFMNALYSKFLVYDPDDAHWIARDRFFLDPGHMSTMLYSVLALSGKYTMAELEQFRQWDSVTPGHPELDVERGIENASGPLGQGHAMAVGCAIAERFLVARFGETFAHKTYAYISDGGVQEEVSQGAGRLAGHLGLHNLIMFYDSNEVQLSTHTKSVTDEDTAAKYRAWGWNVIEIDGNDVNAIIGALEVAHAEKKRPTLIMGHTVMAKGVVGAGGVSLEGAVNTHGQPLTAAGADLDATIRGWGGDPANPFTVFPEVAEMYKARQDELRKKVAAKRAAEKEWAAANPELAAEFRSYIEEKMPDIDWDAIEFKPDMASRNSSAVVLGVLAEHVGNMLVSSADLANSDKTDGFLKKTYALTRDDFGGAFLHSGVAELTMACVMNGVVLHGAMRGACGTFFVFSDYIKPSLRISALMENPVLYIFTHDAFRVGEDGPTHQPIEQEAQARLLEMMNNHSGKMSTLVLRPADSAEVVESYRMALENQHAPTVMILSRQNLEDLPGSNGLTRRESAQGARRGGYVITADADPEIVLMANGSEVALLLHVAEKLREQGHRVALCSFPSIGLFMRQDKAYRDSVLPEGVNRFALSAGLAATFLPLMQGAPRYDVMGMDRFGASAPYKVLDQKFGFTVDNVLTHVDTFMK